MGALEGRQLRYHVPWIYRVYFTIPPLVFAVFAVATWYCLALHCQGGSNAFWTDAGELRRSAWQLVFFGLFHTAAALYFGYSVVKMALEVRRARIAVDGRGMRINDWRNRKSEVLWEAIEEVRITTFGGVCGGVLCPRPPVRIVSVGGSMSLSPWVQDRQWLVDEIVARAELEKASEKWFRTTYRRKQS